MIIETLFFFVFTIMVGETVKEYQNEAPWEPNINVLYENDPYLMDDVSQYPIDLNL